MMRQTLLLVWWLVAAIYASSTHSADLLVEETVMAARAAARDDRNSEAMRLFQQAIAQVPQRRLDWLRELADQTTYAGYPADAIPLYQEFLASSQRSNNEVRLARLGLGLALSWDGKKEAALQAYEIVLQENSADREAQLGRAQVQSWSGRQRLAVAELRTLLREHPDDKEALLLLAQAQYWMGRSDVAKQTLNRLLQIDSGDKRARRLQEEIARWDRQTTSVHYQQSDQSDGLRIGTITFAHDVRKEDGRTTIGPRLQRIIYAPEGAGRNNITVTRPGLFVRHRLEDAWEVTGNAYLDLIDAQAGESDHTTLTFDTYITYWPSDLYRFDIGLNRATFDNITSLNKNITATTVAVSVDVTPDDLVRYTMRLSQADFSDNNAKTRWQGEVEARLLNQPKLYLGGRYTGFKFDQQLSNGYYNPGLYNSLVVTVRSDGALAPRWWYDLEGSAGVEVADPGGNKLVGSLNGRIGFQVSDRVDIEGQYGYFSSSLASSSGFSRGTAGLLLRVRW